KNRAWGQAQDGVVGARRPVWPRLSAEYHGSAINRHAVLAPQPLWLSLSRGPNRPSAGPGAIRRVGRRLPRLRTGRGRLGGLGQRRRVVRLAVEVRDDVGTLAAAGQAGKGHRRARNERARIGQEGVEVVHGPLAALALHGGRIVEAGNRGAVASHHAVKVGSHAIRLALVEGMAGLALLGR